MCYLKAPPLNVPVNFECSCQLVSRMGGAYNTTKGNDKIYAPEIENEIKLNVKEKKFTTNHAIMQ